MKPLNALLDLEEQAERSKKHVEQIRETITNHPSLFAALESMDLRVTFSIQEGEINLGFTGNANTLGLVWNVLRRYGYQPGCRPNKSEPTFYTWWTKEGASRIWMSFSSTVCRRVQVGTQTVEQPIYEIHCGELPLLEAESVDDSIPF